MKIENNLKKYMHMWYLKNKKRILLKVKKRSIDKKEEIREKQKQYYLRNKKMILLKNQQRFKENYKKNIKFRKIINLRHRIYDAFKNFTLTGHQWLTIKENLSKGGRY